MSRPPPRRRCAKCGKHSARGRELRQAHRVTVMADPRAAKVGDELAAGSWVCWRHWMTTAMGALPSGLMPVAKHRTDRDHTLTQGDLWAGPVV